jgi:hypothetical protein
MRHSNNLVCREERLRCFGAVNAAIVQVHIEPTRVWLSAMWKYRAQELFHNILEEVLGIQAVPLRHPIDDVEFVESPKDGQHKLSCPDCLLHPLRGIIARHAPFRRMLELQSQPTLVASYTSSRSIFLLTFLSTFRPTDR